MPKPAKRSVNESDRRHFLRIANHHFHDATLEKISLVPAVNKRQRARVEVLLSFPHVELAFSLTFTGCTNVALALDFDVLADNLPYNTAGFSKVTETAQIQQFITSQVQDWNTGYGDVSSPSPSCIQDGDSPLRPKLARAKSLTLHRVSYFGGELTIVATTCKIKRLA